MNLNKINTLLSKLFSGTNVLFACVVFFIGISISENFNRRQYASGIINRNNNVNEDASSDGMRKFFFNARKNPLTNKMDYPAMLEAYNADLALRKVKRTHDFSSFSTLPNFNWNSLGPVDISGSVKTL